MSDELKGAGAMSILPTTPIVVAPPTPMSILEKAVAQGANVETLDKLLNLQTRWEANEARKAYDAAIADARADIKPIVKSRKAGFESRKVGAARTEFDYEDLAAVAEAIDPVLAKYGLSYRYSSRVEHPLVYVTCIISHRMGHREETTLSGPVDSTGSKNPIQQIGSTVSYLQRYTLKLAMGLAAAKDDDGNGGDPQEDKPRITEAQLAELNNLFQPSGETPERLLKALPGVKSLSAMTQEQFEWAKGVMVDKIAKKSEPEEAKVDGTGE